MFICNQTHLQSNTFVIKSVAIKSFAISNICNQHSFAIMTHLRSNQVAISNICNQDSVVIKTQLQLRLSCNQDSVAIFAVVKQYFILEKSTKNKNKIWKLYSLPSLQMEKGTFVKSSKNTFLFKDEGNFLYHFHKDNTKLHTDALKKVL